MADGQSVGIALELLGAAPLKDATGRVARFELQPLASLRPPGRPRVDVLLTLSGIFRDSFAHVVELLDDLCERAAAADEPPHLNFLRKHALELAAKGVARPAARLFSNPAGDYGSMCVWKTQNKTSSGRVGGAGPGAGEGLCLRGALIAHVHCTMLLPPHPPPL